MSGPASRNVAGIKWASVMNDSKTPFRRFMVPNMRTIYYLKKITHLLVQFYLRWKEELRNTAKYMAFVDDVKLAIAAASAIFRL